MVQFNRTRFTGQDVTVHLPDNVTACDIGTLTLWCRSFRAFFTSIEIKRSLFVSPMLHCRYLLFLTVMTGEWVQSLVSLSGAFSVLDNDTQ